MTVPQGINFNPPLSTSTKWHFFPRGSPGMTKPALAVSLDKPFCVRGTWWAQAHVAPQYLLAGVGSTEVLARQALQQELKDFEKQLEQRAQQHGS
jgi:hypothetical protein